MKKKPETKRADSLPAFLASHAEDKSEATAGEDAMPASEEPVVATADPEVDAMFAADDAATDNADALDALGATGDATGDAADAPAEEPEAAEPATAAPEARARDAMRAPPAAGGGALAMCTGVAALLAAAAVLYVPALAAYAAAATALCVLGAVLTAIGAMQRSGARVQKHFDDAERRRNDEGSALKQQLQMLVDERMQKAPAEGEELQHVLMALQRQDEKINNLTKAIKMYGKPLMEISGQGAELASAIAAVKTVVEAGADETRESAGKLEAQLRAAAGSKELGAIHTALEQLAARVDGGANEARTASGKLETQLRAAGKSKELAEVGAALEQLTARLEGLGKKGPAISLEPLEKHLGRLEVAVAAVAQRLEDSEVRKSLLRLEESTQKGRDAVDKLLRGDAVKEAATQLQGRVEAATKGLADGLARLREGNLGGLEAAVREIQREVSGVATTVAQINAAMKGGARVAVGAAPAPASAAAAPATAAPAPAAAGAPVGAPTATPTGAPATGGYATGSHTSGSKNVLGAIAKLKRMKG